MTPFSRSQPKINKWVPRARSLHPRSTEIVCLCLYLAAKWPFAHWCLAQTRGRPASADARRRLSGVAPGAQNRCGGGGGGGRGRCRTAISAPITAAARCLPRGRRAVRLHRNQTCNPQSSRRTANWRRRRDELLCVLSVPIAGARRGATGGPFALHLHTRSTYVCYSTGIQILLQCRLGYVFFISHNILEKIKFRTGVQYFWSWYALSNLFAIILLKITVTRGWNY